MKRFLRGISLALAAFREQARAERAHFGNFWFVMLSKLMFNLMFILFIDQLFMRIGQFADYNKNDFLVLYLTSQLGFYICYYGIFYALNRMIMTVRNGNFDLLLLKPVPHRSFMYISGMQPYEMILTAAPSMFIIILLINWGALHITLMSFLLGFVVWLCGIIICNTLLFALTLPVFKTGEATDTLSSFYSITSMAQMPFTKLPQPMKVAALVIFPQIIIAGATSEVMLMKTEAIGLTLLLVAVAIVSIIVVNWLWRYALRNYTSVTS